MNSEVIRHIIELLDCDPRPTFVLDLHYPSVLDASRLRPIFCNDAITRLPHLEGRIGGKDECGEESSGGLTTLYRDFVAWTTAANQTHCHINSTDPVISFWGFRWDCYTIGQRWRVVGASARDHQSDDNHDQDVQELQPRDQSTNEQDRASEITTKATKDMFGAELREYPSHIQLIRSIDWSSTSAGPMNEWPDQLRQMCNLMVADPDPCLIFWGSDLAVLYNEAAVPIIADRHPHFMGQKVSQISESFAEICDDYFAALLETVVESEKVCKYENVLLCLQKRGTPEEIFFNYTYLPLVDSNGAVPAIYARLVDVTVDALARRRASILRQMSNNTADATAIEEVWKGVLKTFGDDGNDVPVALMYSVQDTQKDRMRSSHTLSIQTCILYGSVGTSTNQTEDISILHLDQGASGLPGLLLEASKCIEPRYAPVAACGPTRALFSGVKGRAHGAPCTHVVVCSIRPTSRNGAIGFLVMGLNPRKPFNDVEYQGFIRDVQIQLSACTASVLLLAAERKRGRTIAEHAAINQAKLTATVAEWIEEAERHERTFKEFVKVAPVGVNMTNAYGVIHFANDFFYDLTGYDRSCPNGYTDWVRVIYFEDFEKAKAQWKRVAVAGTPLSVEFRVNKPWTPPCDSYEQPFSWILVSNYAIRRDGRIDTLITCVTDINTQKWAESVQLQRVNDAFLAKQEQDEFIDMTSHELRNPLSVVLQSAEEIVSSVSSIPLPQQDEAIATIAAPSLRTIVDAAETIYYCTQHQKRIVDDILTLSKVNSGLLPVTPTPCQPLATIEESIRIYVREIKAADISFTLELDASFAEFALDWLMLDRGRLTQIFLNMLGNAIKFTKSQPERRIRIKIYAFEEEPPGNRGRELNYLQPEGEPQDPTTGAEWGSDDTIFIEVTLEDSGPGLSHEESTKLFRRFSQATRRTHVQYGGSGLGLFICRLLAEMHGGQVGFTSKSGEGSVFAFYIKCRRTKAPPAPVVLGKVFSNLDRDTITIVLPGHTERPGHVVAVAESRVVAKKIGKKRGFAQRRSVDSASEGAPLITEHDILIIEDNLTNQRVLARQLMRLGHRVSVANHGQEGLDHVVKTHFWISPGAASTEIKLPLTMILSDIEMPVMGGLEFVSQLRNLQREGIIRSHIPVIAITGNARPEQVAKAKDAGMDDVILKPFDILTVIKAMSKLESSTISKVIALQGSSSSNPASESSGSSSQE